MGDLALAMEAAFHDGWPMIGSLEHLKGRTETELDDPMKLYHRLSKKISTCCCPVDGWHLALRGPCQVQMMERGRAGLVVVRDVVVVDAAAGATTGAAYVAGQRTVEAEGVHGEVLHRDAAG